ncbi:RING finger protein 37-like isoform X2 [Homarus americanus]|nr:RING finger protein 37-like isoform X2 [Homarus americanus]
MNFCAGCLSPRIATNKPGTDDRDVTNLISGDPSARRKGFMLEYFIRPPIDISLEFPVPVDISHIKLETKLEHMCSTGFAVFTRPEEHSQHKQQQVKLCGASSSPNDVSSSGLACSGPAGASQTQKPVNSYPLSMNFYSCSPPPSLHDSGPSAAFSTSLYSDNVPSKHTIGELEEKIDDIYFCVGKYFTQNEEQIVLKNPHYKQWMNIHVPELGGACQGSRVYNGTLRHPNRLALRCVKKVIIRILKTSEKGPPVLRSVEIWGQPGISSSKTERKELLKKWANRIKMEDSLPLVPRMYNSSPEENKREIPIGEALKIKDSLEIPEDFLDPLTCDVMTVPLLLPSGHSIDAYTLERFITNEALWGRPPSDPFTGVPFRVGMKPSPNVLLKARIDRFLLLNADLPEVQRTARTVGSAHSFITHRSSHPEKSKEMEINLPCFTKNRKRKHEGGLKLGDPDDQVDQEKSMEDKNLNNEFNAQGAEIVTNKADESSLPERGQGLDDTLEAEIEAVLRGKPKYVPTNINEKILGNNYKRETKNTGEKIPLKSRLTMTKCSASRVRLQAVNHTVSSMKRPAHLSHVVGKEASSGHHGLVHMIGGALSVTHGRAVKVNSIPVHVSSAKPTSLISGDCKSQLLDLTSHSLVRCSCGEKEGLYRLPCCHIMCRSCLIQKTKGPEVVCGVCEIMCKRLDISRHHEKSIFS